MTWKLILASGSPRRRELLENINLSFDVVTSEVDEEFDPGLSPDQIVQHLARKKAKAVALKQQSQTVVVGADTIVVLDGNILGKPKDREEAEQMLAALSGRSHEVYTGIAIIVKDEAGEMKQWTDARRTEVWMRKLSPQKISWYLDTKEPMDKAGAYGIQGVGACLIDRIEGCYFNVVGFSLSLFEEMMDKGNLPLFQTFGQQRFK